MAAMDFKKILFYSKLWEKENRNIKITEEFVPIVTKKPITGKFYSKYEVLQPRNVPEDYIQLIERQTEHLPKDIYSYKPPTTNMEYGWFSTPLVSKSTDPRLYFPLNYTDIVKNEMRIRNIDKHRH